MASKLQDCSVCLRDSKYICINCKIPVCNLCSELEFKEDIEGWIPGKVGYCCGCTRKLKFKGKFKEGTRDNKDESINTELEASKR